MKGDGIDDGWMVVLVLVVGGFDNLILRIRKFSLGTLIILWIMIMIYLLSTEYKFPAKDVIVIESTNDNDLKIKDKDEEEEEQKKKNKEMLYILPSLRYYFYTSSTSYKFIKTPYKHYDRIYIILCRHM